MKAKIQATSHQSQIGLGQKELLSLIPLLHVLCSCVFIFGYARAFGYKIITLFGISDVFQISIRNVIQIYFIVLIPFFVLLFSRSRSGYISHIRIPVSALAIICALIVSVVVGSKITLLFEYKPLVQISVATIVALLALQGWWIHSNSHRSWNSIGIALGFSCYLLVFSFLVGVHVGLQDSYRHLQLNEKYLACFGADGRLLGALYGRINDQDMVLVPEVDGQYLIGKDMCHRLETFDPIERKLR